MKGALGFCLLLSSLMVRLWVISWGCLETHSIFHNNSLIEELLPFLPQFLSLPIKNAHDPA